MFAAQHRRIPTIIHEQNAILGLANILLASGAKTLALTHADTKGLKPSWKNKSVTTGNPVRSEIISARDKFFPLLKGQLNLLVFGGSLGAASFAKIIPHSIVKLAQDLQIKLNITHQVREADIGEVTRIYNDSGLQAEIKSFFDNIPERIETTHLLICRSGATTIAETTCAGRAAIYIPYPWHKDQQQLHNAQVVVDMGGGWLIEEKNLTIDTLYQVLKSIVPTKLEPAAAHARSLGKPDAVLKLADQVKYFCDSVK
jgi:UDP-N-acetylglucosamine--N-acetylmuramyl-(pentapeptide) pyrophosphoryl-undecaprenol N-acetylglucosamine transferase